MQPQEWRYIKLMFFYYRHHLVLLVNLYHSIMFMLVGVDQAQVILMMNKHFPPGNGLGCPYGKFLAGPPGPGPGLKVEGSLQAVVLVVIQEVFLMGGPPSSGSTRKVHFQTVIHWCPLILEFRVRWALLVVKSMLNVGFNVLL